MNNKTVKLITTLITIIFCLNISHAQDMGSAAKLYAAKKYEKAYSEYSALYQQNKKNWAALRGMGWSRMQQGRLDAAEKIFTDMRRRAPFQGAKQGLAAITAKRYYRFNVAWGQYNAGKYSAAVKTFTDIVKDDNRPLPEKELWRVYIGLGHSRLAMGKYTDAGKSYYKSLKQKENSEAYKGLGKVAFQGKKYGEAISAFHTSLKLVKGQYDVNSLIAWSYLRSGDPDKAIALFKKQAAINPRIADVRYGLGLAFHKKGNKKVALGEFNAVIALLPGYLANDEFIGIINSNKEYRSVYANLGWALYFAGNYQGSLKILEAGAKKYSHNAVLLRGIAYAALKTGKYNKAIKYSNSVLASKQKLLPVRETVVAATGVRYSFYGNALSNLAWALFYKKDYTKAIKTFQKVLGTHPDWADANSGLGWVYYTQKKYAQAGEQFSKAIKLNLNYADAYSGLAAIRNAKLGRSGEGWRYYYLGQYKKAVKSFSAANKKGISREAREQVWRGLGWSQLRLKENKSSAKYFGRLLKSNARDADATLGLAFSLYEQKNYPGAIEKLKKAVKLYPLNVNAEIALGWSYYNTSNYADSLIEFRRASMLNPKIAEPYRGIGLSLVKLGRIVEGKASLVTAINLYPRGVDNKVFEKLVGKHDSLKDLYITLAWSYHHRGQPKQAVKTAQKIKDAGIKYGDMNLLLGYINYKEKQYKNAASYLEKYLASAPGEERGFGKYSNAYTNLGWSFYYQKEYNKSLGVFKKLAALHKKDDFWAVPYDGMGWSYLKAGDKSRAKEMFIRALRLAPRYANSLAGLNQLKK